LTRTGLSVSAWALARLLLGSVSLTVPLLSTVTSRVAVCVPLAVRAVSATV
jgi:hypothetical protein